MRYSVIIPVYNAEKTLRRCLDSLLEQNCADAEIILVNDGSKDDSEAICEEYAGNYCNVCCFSQPNSGVSAARNAGLDVAQGEYILFVDSDDYVADSFFSVIREAIGLQAVDLLHFSYATFKNGRIEEHKLPRREYTGGKMEKALQQAICDKSLNSPWAKAYRRDIIEKNQIRFPIGISIAEDRLFNMEYALQVQSYLTLDTVGYYLSLENEQSLSRRKNDLDVQNKLFHNAFTAMLTRSSSSPERKDQIRRAGDFGSCRGVYAKAKNMHREQLQFRDRVHKIKESCREFNNKNLKMPNTGYCRLVSLPIRWNLALVIDAMAAILVRRQNN